MDQKDFLFRIRLLHFHDSHVPDPFLDHPLFRILEKEEKIAAPQSFFLAGRFMRGKDLVEIVSPRPLDSGRPAVVHVDVDPVAHLWAPNLAEFKEMHGEPVG